MSSKKAMITFQCMAIPFDFFFTGLRFTGGFLGALVLARGAAVARDTARSREVWALFLGGGTFKFK